MISTISQRPRGRASAGGTVPDGAARGQPEQPPLPYPAAILALAGCVACAARLLGQRRVHRPPGRVGRRLHFADGTSARVYRETVVARGRLLEPCVLVVAFRLRMVRGRGHAVFRAESLLNTPLFVGFPGFASKLWLASDERDRYRGLYEWDGPRQASHYARALWRVLALVSVPGSIHYMVLPGLRRDDLLKRPRAAAAAPAPGPDPDPGGARPDSAGPDADTAPWWRLVEVS